MGIALLFFYFRGGGSGDDGVKEKKRKIKECSTDLQNKIGSAVKRILMPTKNPRV
jgi:hypothetical protein